MLAPKIRQLWMSKIDIFPLLYQALLGVGGGGGGTCWSSGGTYDHLTLHNVHLLPAVPYS